MTFADIPVGLRLCRVSAWNQTARDWEHFLAFGRGLVAVERGAVVGTIATLPYGPFAWISMVLVDPAARGRGIGTMLLKRGLALVPHGSVARLDATASGEIVYRQIGFVAEYGLTRLLLEPRTRGAARTAGARPLAKDDWPTVLEMDAPVFGASRSGLLERLRAEAPEYAWVAERHGRLDGYLLGRHGHVREHLGPLIADNAETAGLLLDACLAANPDRRVCIDVLDDQQAFVERLVHLGFAAERAFLRMHLGRLATPGQPSRVYAVAGPEFG